MCVSLVTGQIVAEYLEKEIDCLEAVEEVTTVTLRVLSFWDSALNASAKLVAGLVMKTETNYSIHIMLENIGILSKYVINDITPTNISLKLKMHWKKQVPESGLFRVSYICFLEDLGSLRVHSLNEICER